VNQHGDVCVVEYLDEHGRRMTTKEAYRRLSYKFHGKAPIKNKVEKRYEKELKELRRNRVSTETPLSTLTAIQKTTAATNTPFVVVGATIKPDLSTAPKQKKKKNSKNKPERRTSGISSTTPTQSHTDSTPTSDTRTTTRTTTSTATSGLDSGMTTPSRHTKGTTTFTNAAATSAGTPILETGKKVSFGFKR